MALNALNTAAAGLKLTQAQIGIVSQNVANAGTVGYVRRTLDAVTTGPGNSGVAGGTISRTLDAAALKQMRLETSGAAYTAINASVRAQLDKLYGIPGNATALDGMVNGFASSLQALASDPSSAAARTAAVTAASGLASKIGSIAGSVQDLRSAIESQLAQDTAQASSLLSSIADLNTRISQAGGASKADLLDQRDQAVNALSALMDLQTVEQRDGTVSVITTTGVTLVDRGTAAALSFDSRGALTPEAAFSTDPAQRGVGTITARTPGGGTIDLVAAGAIRSGSIAASLEMRDAVLPQAQRQLDDLAAGLSRAMSDKSVGGTANGPGVAIDLTGIKAGNAITIPVTSGGVTRNIVLIASDSDTAAVDATATNDSSAYAQTFRIPRDAAGNVSTDPNAFVAAIGAALAAMDGRQPVSARPPQISVGVVSGRLTLSGSGTVALLGAEASITVPGSINDTTAGLGQLPLFIDGSGNRLFTGSFDGGSQLTGFAQRIKVNPVVSGATSSLVAKPGTNVPSDSARPQALYEALTSTQRTFSAASGVSGTNAPTTSSVSGFAQSIIATQGAAAASAQDLDEGQSIALATAQGRFSAEAGVSIDEEMSKLIELQTAYTANARVLTAARDMLDTLLRI